MEVSFTNPPFEELKQQLRELKRRGRELQQAAREAQQKVNRSTYASQMDRQIRQFETHGFLPIENCSEYSIAGGE